MTSVARSHAWQFAGTCALLISCLAAATPAAAQSLPVPDECQADVDGANDVPGQRDLTSQCAALGDGAPYELHTIINLDETTLSGNNTADACTLFNTDGDAFVNLAVCVTTASAGASEGNRIVLDSIRLFSCGNDKVDRCTNSTLVPGPYNTTCEVTQTSADPFVDGDDAPWDTRILCAIDLQDFGSGEAALLDSCSYPSTVPNSDPADCVLFHACDVDADCDDGNLCTADSCDPSGVCVHTPTPGLACNDGLFCNGDDVCNTLGLCAHGAGARDCGDGIGCSVDTCNETTDSCEHTTSDALCDDGAFCNGVETCDAALGCQAGTSPACDDGVGCTTDICDEAADACGAHVPDDDACDDGAFCNGAETCDALLDCQAGPPPDCSDGVACTIDACDEGSDSCTHAADDAACDDGAFCNGAETCDALLGCRAGTPVDCNDGIGCTTEVCNEALDTCDVTPSDAACDDGLFCNGLETCDPALDCRPGAPPDCGDGVGCTADACDEASDSCTHAADDAACDDGLFCNGLETCDPALDCHAGASMCPDAACDETTDTCLDLADLTITASDPGTGANRLDIFPYTVTVTNNGPFPADQVTATVGLDPNTVAVASSGPLAAHPVAARAPRATAPTSVDCRQVAAATLSCSLGTLGVGDSVSFTVAVEVLESAPYVGNNEDDPCDGSEDLCAGFSVTALQPDPDPASNTDDEATNVRVTTRKSDLAITKVDRSSPVQAGGFATYSLTVTNAGPWEAQDARVVDMLDPNTRYVDGTLPCTEYPVGTLTCELGTMAAGASITFDVVVRVDPAALTASSLAGPGCPGGQDLCNRASVSSRSTDLNPDNNSAEVATDVLPTTIVAELSTVKSDLGSEPAPRGTDVTYSIVVTNAGPDVAHDVVVYDTLDAYLSHVSDSVGCTVTVAPISGDERLACPLGDIAAGSSATLEVVTSIARDAPVDSDLEDGDCNGSEDLCNTATAVTTSADFNVADNRDSEPTDASVNLDCNNGVLDPGEECDQTSIEICNDNIDNDGDLLVDCADPACAVSGYQSCDDNCLLTPPCLPILRDPAKISAKRVRIHGRFVPLQQVDPSLDGFIFHLSNAEGEIYSGRLLPGDMTIQKGRLGSDWVFKDKGAKRGQGIRDGLSRVDIKRRPEPTGEISYTFRIVAFGDMSRAVLPRMTTQVYIGDEVAYLTADWLGRPGRWLLTRKAADAGQQ